MTDLCDEKTLSDEHSGVELDLIDESHYFSVAEVKYNGEVLSFLSPYKGRGCSGLLGTYCIVIARDKDNDMYFVSNLFRDYSSYEIIDDKLIVYTAVGDAWNVSLNLYVYDQSNHTFNPEVNYSGFGYGKVITKNGKSVEVMCNVETKELSVKKNDIYLKIPFDFDKEVSVYKDMGEEVLKQNYLDGSKYVFDCRNTLVTVDPKEY
ncbi:hypothetical protein A2W32_02100 [candidate division WWE3 bacterium RBG_16_37_10]|uniref:Uncharacterized protein n=1 Tax=candidate division WWE3 bacterium RBG_16_37_10 TaxID=1802610 RepID=A0A1F4V441_UNCKA|nr:MAG: hypothetical protein A2W32_02100 [candidate division WWE3 bacterium RBG_16_37_10]